ncbi:hypothetical protein BC830DRAFT_1151274 [Chytriomyces sp. MP71]|nr:hypothetical protein BC830DRAFT_1151274 [Chytriomyces sp. MP71]
MSSCVARLKPWWKQPSNDSILLEGYLKAGVSGGNENASGSDHVFPPIFVVTGAEFTDVCVTRPSPGFLRAT